jgi:hypothetical protein
MAKMGEEAAQKLAASLASKTAVNSLKMGMAC